MIEDPWKHCRHMWKNESQYWTWTRNSIRSIWSDHPVKLAFIQARRIKVDNPNPRGRVKKVWGLKCACCGYEGATGIPVKKAKEWKVRPMQIDHIKGESTLKGLKDLGSFVESILHFTFNDLQALCKDCHDVKTYSERMGCSLEDAKKHKKVISVMKDNTIAWQKKYLKGKGYDDKVISNETNRRKCFEELAGL